MGRLSEANLIAFSSDRSLDAIQKLVFTLPEIDYQTDRAMENQNWIGKSSCGFIAVVNVTQ